MTKWEYMNVEWLTGQDDKDNVAKRIGKAGTDGWELVSVTETVGGRSMLTTFWFKRPLKRNHKSL